MSWSHTMKILTKIRISSLGTAKTVKFRADPLLENTIRAVLLSDFGGSQGKKTYFCHEKHNNHTMFKSINFVEIFSSFIVMAAIIDIFGSIPIFVSMKEQNKTIKAGQACLTALGLFLAFFFAGDALLKLLGPNLIFILRKFFGVILLAIAVNMFVNNISVIIANVTK